MSRCRPVAILAALAVVVLAACGGAPSTVTPSTSPSPTIEVPTPALSAVPTASPIASKTNSTTTSGTLPSTLAGTFAAKIDPAVVAAGDEAGDWFLVLTPAEGYQFGRVARGVAENTGDLVVTGNRLTFANEQGLGACIPDGTYAWALHGSQLSLTLVTDGCTVRVNQYVHQKYIRCPADPRACAAVLP